MITLQTAAVGYSKPILRCDLHVAPGDFVLIGGPNGAGKSTLMRTFAGLTPLLSGSRRQTCRKLGWVPQQGSQHYALPVTAREMLELGAEGPAFSWRWAQKRPRAFNEVIGNILDVSWLNRPVSHLSGGQRQRLLLARALATNPDCLLLDEPTAGVDSESQSLLAAILRRFIALGSRAVVLVTHEPTPFLSSANRFLNVDQGEVQPMAATAPNPAPPL